MSDTEQKPKVTAEGGPLDGLQITVDETSTALHALAIKDDGKWVGPREWAAARGIEIAEEAPPRSWPAEVRSRVVQVEYLIDRDHETAAFREPAEIREAPEQEPEREWAAADPRKVQEPRFIAWKSMATALDALGDLSDPTCTHTPPCTSTPMCVARVAMEAVITDGLRFVEPTRLADSAEALAIAWHETWLGLSAERDNLDGTPWPNLLERTRDLYRETASQVLGSIDAHGRVVVLQIPETAPLDLDFSGLGDILRDCGAEVMLAMPAQLGLTLETLDEEQMREAGWVRAIQRPDVELYEGPAAVMIVTSCPDEDCLESFAVGCPSGVVEPDYGIVGTNALGKAIHEHLNAEHPNAEHPEITVQMVDSVLDNNFETNPVTVRTEGGGTETVEGKL